MSSNNKSLTAAKAAKDDEYYTQLTDIEKELKHYKSQFKDKVIYCNCDDPFESNYFKHLASNFNHLGLKKLIATSYAGSPIANKDFKIFKEDGDERPKSAYAIEINEVKDLNGDGAVDLTDVKILLENDANASHELKEDGSFDSPECLKFLEEADIVVTNPPFTIWRHYFETLMKYKKKFLIVGNFLSVSYNEVRPHIVRNEVWLGCSRRGMDFIRPNKEVKSVNACWFTNLHHKKRNEELVLYQKYSPDLYPKYSTYDAIEVSKVKDIPKDYAGEMGVPITFLEKWNPNQFELIGFDDDLPKSNNDFGQQHFGLNGEHVYRRVVIKNRNPEI